MEPLLILLAFFAGLIFKNLGYPAMPGYLLAGFIAHWLGIGDIDLISVLADIGLLLLLFTIGLKLNLRDIIMPQVWAVAGLQMMIAVPLTCLVIIVSGILFPVLALQDTASAWTLAFALSFSSTVFAVKVFQDRGETSTFHAQVAIGVLVIQDILAVGYLVLASGQQPSYLALLIPLLIFLRPLLVWLAQMSRRGELVVLLGFGIALSGSELFEVLGLKGGLGALLMGVIISNSSASTEMYKHMIDLKDLFLIGFFLQIGYYGLPEGHMWLVALALGFLIFLRPMIYFLLFVASGLRARTSLIAGTALFNYSEFGLVVAAYAVSNGVLPTEWLTTTTLAVTVSFFLATPFNTRVHLIYARLGEFLQKMEKARRIRAEMPSEVGDSDIVILGMGRVGRGAYEKLSETFPGRQIMGVEESMNRVIDNHNRGYNCIRADATDHDFWAYSGVRDKELVLVSLTNHNENLSAVELATETGFKGKLAVVSRFPDEMQELESLGCITFNLYAEAGHGFAEHVVEQADLS